MAPSKKKTTTKAKARKKTTKKAQSSGTTRTARRPTAGTRKAKAAKKTTTRKTRKAAAPRRARGSAEPTPPSAEELEREEVAVEQTATSDGTAEAPAPTAAGSRSVEPMRAMGKGVPPPFVVARGEDRFRVLDEAVKYSGFFDRLEELLEESGKPREMFEIAAKVDFLHATRKEDPPASYVDPRLVTHLFDQLLDRGFRLLRVVETRNEISRYQQHRSVKEVGNAVGYDETCFELRDLGDNLVPVAYGGSLDTLAAGQIWHGADCRILFAKNRTDEFFGPALLFYNVFQTLASPTSLIAMDKGIDPSGFVIQSLNEHPVHFSLIDAIVSQDGSAGSGGPFELLTDPDGASPTGASILQTNTILAGQDLLAVEAAGRRMQGLDPMGAEIFKLLRRNLGYKIPAEVDDLPMHEGWTSLGEQIREMVDLGNPGKALRVGLWQRLTTIDASLFPPQPGGFQHVRLKKDVEEFLQEVRTKRGLKSAAKEEDGAEAE